MTTPTPTLVLFHMIGCGHCEALMPTWEKVTTSFPASLTVEASDADIDTQLNVDSGKLMKWKEENVRGYPTIVKVEGGNIVEYDGERTTESILNFAKKRGGKRRRIKQSKSKKSKGRKVNGGFAKTKKSKNGKK